MMVTDIRKLTESPGPLLQKNGAKYHGGEQIITHLNYALGPDGWDWEELDRGYDEMADQVWVLGKLTARFLFNADEHDGYKTNVCSKVERGWNEVKRSRSDRTKLIDLGSDYKGADTDALKRAARLLGVGLDAWEKEGAVKRNVCDAAAYRRKWHATVRGTRFEDDETRHKFIAWYSENHFNSLEKWLDGATDEEADTLIATISQRISDEAKQAAKEAQRVKAAAGAA